jgi:peptidoglycan L-alanyl-D-glutamate endopeptidase CwlK
MEDAITIKRIKLLHPAIVDEVLYIYKNQIVPALNSNVFCRFAYTLRTFEEQNEMYAQGRTKLFDTKGKRLGIITNAKGGQSFHNYGLSFDIVLIDGRFAHYNTVKDYDGDGIADWMEVVDIFKNNGYEWGGDWQFTDNPHLQKTFGYSWQELLEKYNNNDFLPGTKYVRI